MAMAWWLLTGGDGRERSEMAAFLRYGSKGGGNGLAEWQVPPNVRRSMDEFFACQRHVPADDGGSTWQGSRARRPSSVERFDAT